MRVVELPDGRYQPEYVLPKLTDADLQKEYDFLLACVYTLGLLRNGLISVAEFDKLMLINLRTFCPFIAKI